MGRRIKNFPGGAFLEFDRGSFDDWCVFLARPGQERKALRDEEYFAQMIALAERHGREKLYQDYLKVYEYTGKNLDMRVLRAITGLAKREYGPDALLADYLLTVLYAGMIAEENKENTKLGKRVKRLGVYGILMEGQNAQTAANLTRGMKYQQIEAMCEARGF